MSRLKDEVIEDTSKLGEIIENCKLEIESHKNGHIVDAFDHGVSQGRADFADSILKLLGLLKECSNMNTNRHKSARVHSPLSIGKLRVGCDYSYPIFLADTSYPSNLTLTSVRVFLWVVLWVGIPLK